MPVTQLSVVLTLGYSATREECNEALQFVRGDRALRDWLRLHLKWSAAARARFLYYGTDRVSPQRKSTEGEKEEETPARKSAKMPRLALRTFALRADPLIRRSWMSSPAPDPAAATEESGAKRAQERVAHERLIRRRSRRLGDGLTFQAYMLDVKNKADATYMASILESGAPVQLRLAQVRFQQV